MVVEWADPSRHRRENPHTKGESPPTSINHPHSVVLLQPQHTVCSQSVAGTTACRASHFTACLAYSMCPMQATSNNVEPASQLPLPRQPHRDILRQCITPRTSHVHPLACSMACPVCCTPSFTSPGSHTSRHLLPPAHPPYPPPPTLPAILQVCLRPSTSPCQLVAPGPAQGPRPAAQWPCPCSRPAVAPWQQSLLVHTPSRACHTHWHRQECVQGPGQCLASVWG
jgi:hypothetical protein